MRTSGKDSRSEKRPNFTYTMYVQTKNSYSSRLGMHGAGHAGVSMSIGPTGKEWLAVPGLVSEAAAALFSQRHTPDLPL